MSRLQQHCPSWVSDDNDYLNGWGSPLLCSTPKKYGDKPPEPPKVEKPKPMENVPLGLSKDHDNYYLNGWGSPLLRSNSQKYDEKPEETTVVENLKELNSSIYHCYFTKDGVRRNLPDNLQLESIKSRTTEEDVFPELVGAQVLRQLDDTTVVAVKCNAEKPEVQLWKIIRAYDVSGAKPELVDTFFPLEPALCMSLKSFVHLSSYLRGEVLQAMETEGVDISRLVYRSHFV